MQIICTFILAYLLGSINGSIIITRLFGKGDIRKYGSGNAGATNVLRTVGVFPAILVLALDLAKGVFSILLARYLTDNNMNCIVAAGLGAVIGHNYPLYFGFKGGKGIATSMGVLFALNWQVMSIITVIGVILIAITRYVSLGSVTGAFLAPIGIYFADPTDLYTIILTLIIAIFAIVRHKPNLIRLANGTESKIGQKAKTK